MTVSLPMDFGGKERFCLFCARDFSQLPYSPRAIYRFAEIELIGEVDIRAIFAPLETSTPYLPLVTRKR